MVINNSPNIFSPGFSLSPSTIKSSRAYKTGNFKDGDRGDNPFKRQVEAFSNTKNRGEYFGMNEGKLIQPDQNPGLTAIEEAMEEKKVKLIESALEEEQILELEQENLQIQDNNNRQAKFRQQQEQEDYQNLSQEQVKSKIGQINQRQQQFKNEGKKKVEFSESLDNSWFIITLILAILLDLVGFGISFIPVVGQGVSTFVIMPLGMFLVWLVHMVNGVKFSRKNKANLIGTAIFEAIPVLNMLPGITVCVILCKVIPMAENKAQELAKKVGGERGAKAASSIRRKID